VEEIRKGGLLELVWNKLKHVPRGKVTTYGALARAAGLSGGARQVGRALHHLKGVPWHRVVGAGGRILLPGERSLEQRIRLETEGVQFRGGRVDMERHEYQFTGSGSNISRTRAAKVSILKGF
jgi:methylated-DNA-protein-cysteine methyltransferase-like protein